MTGSYERAAWRQSLRDQLIGAGVQPIPAGPVQLTAAITTGRAHTWSNLWKPLIDSLGPILANTRPAARTTTGLLTSVYTTMLNHALATTSLSTCVGRRQLCRETDVLPNDAQRRDGSTRSFPC
jgi:hypothetical protein